MSDELVAIKGVNDGLLISLDPAEEWLMITGELAARLDAQSEFFSGARITVDVGARPVPRHELSTLKALLERRGMTLSVVMSDSETTLAAADALDLRVHTSTEQAEPGVQGETLAIDPEEQGIPGVLIRHTLRSGRIVSSPGHAVIMGDVNPGAEVIAEGDIIVWGKLRGNVHAGAGGDEQAVVCALDMTPNQLRIADYLTTSPPGKRRKVRPEVALIREGQIVVETWDQ